MVVNGDLSKTRTVQVPRVGDGEVLYDPATASEVSDTHLSLKAGEGRILLVTDPQRWGHVTALIDQRRSQARLERLQVERDALERAGVQIAELSALPGTAGVEGQAADGLSAELGRAEEALRAFHDSPHAKSRELQALREIRELFGTINRGLVTPQQTERYDGKAIPEYEALFAEIRELSARYFGLLSQWRHGNAELDLPSIEALRRDVEALRVRVAQQLTKSG